MELSLSISISASRQAAGALARAAPSFMSISSREISMAASWPSRFHSQFRCRRRMARSLVIRVGTLGEDVKLIVLSQQLDLDPFANLLPRLVREVLFQSGEATLGSSYQVPHGRA